MVLSVRFRSAVALAGRYPLLAGVDLDVREGEIVAIRGPNGAGKTSLLRAMAGLLPLVAGEAAVLGVDPTADARALRSRVGLLGHRNGLYDDLTAEENVRFVVRAACLPKHNVTAALERLGLNGRLRTLPTAKLSAGQRRRVALAALMARQPELWLLDEPHAGLDAEHRQLLDQLLKDVARAGASVVLASHEDRAIEVLAQRAVTMSGGMVLDGLLAAEPAAPAAPAGPAKPPGTDQPKPARAGDAGAAVPEEIPNVA